MSSEHDYDVSSAPVRGPLMSTIVNVHREKKRFKAKSKLSNSNNNPGLQLHSLCGGRTDPNLVDDSCARRKFWTVFQSSVCSIAPTRLNEGGTSGIMSSGFSSHEAGYDGRQLRPERSHPYGGRSHPYGVAQAQEKSQPPPTVQKQHDTVPPADLPELWVHKWADYSSKYGIGYVFSDGAVGVSFNDSTNMILDQGGSSSSSEEERAGGAGGGSGRASAEGERAGGAGGGSSSSSEARSLDGPQQFEYITRRTVDTPEQRFVHNLESFPEDLRKKVTVLKHFKKYLLGNDHPLGE